MGTNHKGVRARQNIPPHTSLGYYTGNITNTHIGNHTMQIKHEDTVILVDGTPRTTDVDRERTLSYINEHIHVQNDTDDFPTHGNNVIMKPTGELVTHHEAIKKGQTLYMFYGDSFDWSDLISPLIPHLIRTTQHILQLSNHSDWTSELQEANDRYTILQSSSLTQMIHHYQTTNNQLDLLIYNVVTNKLLTRTTATLPHPTKSANLLAWVTALNTSLPFRWQVVFRRAHSNPPPDWHTLLHPSISRAGGRPLRHTKQINYDEEAYTIDFTMVNAQTQPQFRHTLTPVGPHTTTVNTIQKAPTPPKHRTGITSSTEPEHIDTSNTTDAPIPHTSQNANDDITHTTPSHTEFIRRTAMFSPELTKLRAQLIRDSYASLAMPHRPPSYIP